MDAGQRAFKQLKQMLFIGAIIATVALVYFSLTVRDTSFVRKHPLQFVLEVLLIGLGAAAPLFYLGYTRGRQPKEVYKEFLFLFLKFAGAHIGLQLSGFYTNMFSQRVV
jgi:uncharacterized membrane protein